MPVGKQQHLPKGRDLSAGAPRSGTATRAGAAGMSSCSSGGWKTGTPTWEGLGPPKVSFTG